VLIRNKALTRVTAAGDTAPVPEPVMQRSTTLQYR
jgi:hypothetical protein